MAELSPSAFETKYNNASTGLYKAGQTDGIGSDDHRSLVTDIKDSFESKASAGGIWKPRTVVVKTTAALSANTYNGTALTLTSDDPEVLEIDGYEVQLNDRVLISEEATAANRGVYKLTTVGADGPFPIPSISWVLTREADFPTDAIYANNAVYFVEDGDTNERTFWQETGGYPTLSFEQLNISPLPDNRTREDEVNISSGSILTGNSVGILLKIAPGAGKMLVPVSVTFSLNYNSAAYATNVVFKIFLGAVELFEVYGLLDVTEDTVVHIPFGPLQLPASAINQNLIITVNDGDPTAGNSPMKALVKYNVITI